MQKGDERRFLTAQFNDLVDADKAAYRSNEARNRMQAGDQPDPIDRYGINCGDQLYRLGNKSRPIGTDCVKQAVSDITQKVASDITGITSYAAACRDRFARDTVITDPGCLVRKYIVVGRMY